ncbi:hypothetical protein LWI28_017862 [Acer negundo]|uniref:GTPase Der C-terminal KH-domain-like domain-containing protein n=1 Tax=Acer negundo TaxID=4023 RepID=A0AAD5J4Y8_ACENE|nr:hypothetical protein LWI28_017862 [Acer negundo]
MEEKVKEVEDVPFEEPLLYKELKPFVPPITLPSQPEQEDVITFPLKGEEVEKEDTEEKVKEAEDVISKHSKKDLSTQPKVKYFTQVKARPPTFVAFLSQKTELSDTDLCFLTKSLKKDFDLGGIPIRIMQKTIPRKSRNSNSKSSQSTHRMVEMTLSDKRITLA